MLIDFLETPRGAFVTVTLIFLLWLVGGILMYNYFYILSPQAAGTFGDMFGVLTSLFSAFTVIGIFYTIRLQKKELNETRDELKRQTETLIKQSETSNKQNLNFILQRFESTLFNLISIYQDNVANYKEATGKMGKEVFAYSYGKIKSKINNQSGYGIDFIDGNYQTF